MSLSPLAAEPLARKALLLQSAIAGVCAFEDKVPPQLACALDELPDIVIENHGSIVLLHPVTPAGRAWLDENCDRSGYQPFTGGALLCEPRYVGDIVVGAADAGLIVGTR
jgi:hypothetical protein